MKAIIEVDIVLASPSDTVPEREAAVRVVGRLNDGYCREHNQFIRLLRWEDVAPSFHEMGAQAPIDRALNIPASDVLIGIFWQRFGTPVKAGAPSGTIHEFEAAYHSWKATRSPQIMFYFKTKPPERQPSPTEAEDLARVLRFKEEFPGEGLYKDFYDTEQFETQLETNLKEVLGHFTGTSGANQPQIQAVVFTHFGSLSRMSVPPPSCVEAQYEEVIASYCKCSRIGIVYVYVDRAVRKAIAGEDKTASQDDLLIEERKLIHWLEERKKVARDKLRMPPGTGPRFHFVGLDCLQELLRALKEVDPDLLHLLHGHDGRFTYDAPKFVEAVIRLARGDSPHLAVHPVMRIDEDARANDEAIAALLEQFVETSRTKPFYLFSGAYGSAGVTDHLNDHAVRTHWFVPTGTHWADSVSPELGQQIGAFLADIGQLGAPQLTSASPPYSSAMRGLIEQGRLTAGKRPSPQVISGAGLIMSRKAVDLLPPLMNLSNLTLWVDDHIKRRLHEILGDMEPDQPERLVQAKFVQNRHPNGVTSDERARAIDYFPRVLRGCLFQAIVVRPLDTPMPYGELIRDIVLYRDTTNDHRLDITTPQGRSFRAQLFEAAQERFELVRACWISSEFRGTDLYDWASNLDSRQAAEFCDQVTEDAIAYARLVQRWHVFVRAIQRLPYYGTRWLFEPVPRVTGPYSSARARFAS